MTESPKTSQEKPRFRILALDGGGVRGVLSAQILQKMETYLNSREETPLPLGQRFDLIAGTSVGAILGLSLAMGRSAAETLEYWAGGGKDKDGKGGKVQEIFGHPKSRLKWLFFCSKHDASALEEALKSWFCNKKLCDLGHEKGTTHVLVTATALAKPSLRTWKSPSDPRYADRAKQQLADVARASAAAPTFFPPQQKELFDPPNVDGGLCANNPAVIAIVEALGRRYELDQIDLVSVGTGIPCGMSYDPNKIGKGGAKRWLFSMKHKAVPLIELMMEAQSDMTHQQANFMLKGRGRYLRINPQLKFPMTLDEMEKVGYLKAYSDLTREEYAKLGELML